MYEEYPSVEAHQSDNSKDLCILARSSPILLASSSVGLSSRQTVPTSSRNKAVKEPK